MNKIVIVVDEDGQYATAYADSETEVVILRKGKDDRQIDEVEQVLEEV